MILGDRNEYEIHRKYCRECKKLVEADVPNALPNSPFGLNLMLFVTVLKIGMALPYNKIKQLLLTMYNLDISEGGLVSILFQIKKEFGPLKKLPEIHYSEMHRGRHEKRIILDL